ARARELPTEAVERRERLLRAARELSPPLRVPLGERSAAHLLERLVDAPGGAQRHEELRERAGACRLDEEPDEARDLGEGDHGGVRAREHRDGGAELVERKVELELDTAHDDALRARPIVERTCLAPSRLFAARDAFVEPERRSLARLDRDGEVRQLV